VHGHAAPAGKGRLGARLAKDRARLSLVRVRLSLVTVTATVRLATVRFRARLRGLGG
jgi:hypothetical protein